MNLVTCAFLCSAVLLVSESIASSLQEPQQKTPQSQADQVEPQALTPLESAKNKEILDLCRRGVAIISVNTYASASGTKYEQNQAWFATGFIVDKEKGIVATNKHVVGEMTVSTYELKFSDGSVLPASLLYFDPTYDFAFLKVDPKKLPQNAIELSIDETPVAVNQTVFCIGNAGKNEFSSFKGEIFNIYESIGPFPDQTFQFSAITVGGASGSPVFNEVGKVVGILYGGKFISGAALPIKYVKTALEALKKGETPKRQTIGAMIEYMPIEELLQAGLIPQDAFDTYLKEFPHANKKVLVISRSVVSSPSHTVLRAGDIIWKVGGAFIGPELYQLDTLINQTNDPVSIEVYRNGKHLTLSVKPTTFNMDPYFHFVSFGGAMFYEDSFQTTSSFGAKEPGIFVSAIQRTSAFKGLTSGEWWSPDGGMKILEIDGTVIQSLNDLITIIPKLKSERRVEVRFKNLLGTQGFGDSIVNDRGELFAILSYSSKFDSPKEYKFNHQTLEWDVKDLSTVVGSTKESAKETSK